MPNFESGDWSIPSFKYTAEQREELRQKGHSDAEIDQLEARKNLDLAEDQLRRELGDTDLAA